MPRLHRPKTQRDRVEARFVTRRQPNRAAVLASFPKSRSYFDQQKSVCSCDPRLEFCRSDLAPPRCNPCDFSDSAAFGGSPTHTSLGF